MSAGKTMAERLSLAEQSIELSADAFAEEKRETRKYRSELQGDVKELRRDIHIGMGILIAINILLPLILKLVFKI